jgi:hypothetical protein
LLVIGHRPSEAFSQGNTCLPTKPSQSGHIKDFSRRAIGFRRIPGNLPRITNGCSNAVSELADRKIDASTNVEKLQLLRLGLPRFQAKHGSISEVINV